MPTHRAFIALLGLLVGLSPLAIDMYLPSMPAIAEDLAASPAAVQMTVSVYLFFFAIPQLFFGPLSDALGRRRTIFLGLALFTTGAVLCMLAPSIELLLAARAIQATGSAAISVTVPALVRDRFSGPDYTSTMGFIMMVMGIAPMLAPLAGGLIFTFGGWRGIFLTLVLIAVLSALLFKLLIPETLASKDRYTLQLDSLLANYKLLFTDRHCLGLALCASLVFAGLMTFVTASPFVYIELYGISPQLYGVLFGANVIGTLSLTYTSNRLVYRWGNEKLLRLSVGIIVFASLCLLLISFMSRPPLLAIILCCGLFIANMGIMTSNVMAVLMSRFARIAGATSAVVGTLRFGVAALAGTVVSLWHTDTSTPLTAVMAGCGFLLLAIYLWSGPKPDAQEAVA
jgi:DHA1 family bicyclomycin/chloramphenicol resistance-like MFS transporter